MKPALLSHLSPFMKILFVLMLVFSGLIIAVMGSVLITMLQYHADMTRAIFLLSGTGDPSAISLLKEMQILQSVFLFIVPAFIAGYLFENSAWRYFGMKKNPGWIVLLLVVLILFFSLPLINWMVSLNEMIRLPASLSGLEEWIQNAEDQAGEITKKFLDVQSLGGFAVNLLMIAIIPAVGEELLFRGLFQRLFNEWFRNIHVAIFLSALLFGLVLLLLFNMVPITS